MSNDNTEDNYQAQNINIEKLPEFDNHELVSFFSDNTLGLKGFIVIYNTNLGPAAGATRFYEYSTDIDALQDALRLSKAMTYKNALAGLPYGGGKAVIIGNPNTKKTDQLIQAYAEKINLLSGNFFTGQDSGMNLHDVKVMSQKTRYVIGASEKSNNPPLWTALGIFYAMQAALKEIFGTEEIRGRTFAIKGLGNVGRTLCRILDREGGIIIGADIDPQTLQEIKKEFPRIRIVSPQSIHQQKVDVYSPCALSGDLSTKVISELQCKLVCGGANSQLALPENGKDLFTKGILYIPDYLANAGGVINVVDELEPEGYSATRVQERVAKIKDTTTEIIELSKKLKESTDQVANALAEKIFYKRSN